MRRTFVSGSDAGCLPFCFWLNIPGESSGSDHPEAPLGRWGRRLALVASSGGGGGVEAHTPRAVPLHRRARAAVLRAAGWRIINRLALLLRRHARWKHPRRLTVPAGRRTRQTASKPPVRVPGQPPEKNPSRPQVVRIPLPSCANQAAMPRQELRRSCPAGQVRTKSGSCRAAPGVSSATALTYDPPGVASDLRRFTGAPLPRPPSSPNSSVSRQAPAARESTCSQSPMSQACADLTQWYRCQGATGATESASAPLSLGRISMLCRRYGVPEFDPFLGCDRMHPSVSPVPDSAPIQP